MAKKRMASTSSNTVQNGAGNFKSGTSQSEMTKRSNSSKILDAVELKDGTKVKLNDFIYMRAEIPYEPYYVGRVMEFIPHPKYPKELQVRVAWFYRPKDIFSGRRKHFDPRLLVATMHSDLNPVSSIRGLCSIMHEAHVDGHTLEEYKRGNDHFYYSQLYDRYCRASYDVVPCENVRNVPGDVAKALQERFQYILVEAGMAGEFTEAHRVCKHCSKWAASADSLRCAVCTSSYHMACLDPPLTKKPTKGYAWQCAACLRSQKDAKELENSFLQLGDRGAKTAAVAAVKSDGNGKAAIESNEEPVENITSSSERENKIPAIGAIGSSVTAAPDVPSSPSRPSTAKRSNENLQTSESQKWPFRYFGIHTHVNDVFDYDARINPRAASRIGNRYQCNIPTFNSEPPVALPTTVSKTPMCSTTASSSTSPVAHRAHSLRLGETTETDSDSIAVVPKAGRGRPRKIPIGGVSVAVKRKDALEKDVSGNRFGILQRGFDPPVFEWPKDQPEEKLDSYIMAVKEQPRSFPCPPHSADLLDRALLVLAENEYNTEAALKVMEKIQRTDLGISFIEWSEMEKTKFEECMMNWGHDLVGAKNYVPTKTSQEIVRYFYSWKKSDRYLPVYGVYAKKFKPNKKFKIRGVPLDSNTGHPMDANSTPTEEEDDDDDDDENAPLPDDGTLRVCSNCATSQSSIWRTAPPAHMLGETTVSHVAPHGRSGITKGAAGVLMENGTEGAVKTFCDDCSIYWLKYGFLRLLPQKKKEDGRKKDIRDGKSGIPPTEVRQKRTYTKRKKPDADEDTASHSPVRFRKITGPCDVCQTMEQRHGQDLILCNHCGLTVHVECYGISQTSLISSAGKRWACDTCRNSAGPTASTDYACVLCTPSKRSLNAEHMPYNQNNNNDVVATHRASGASSVPVVTAVAGLNLTKPRAVKKTIGNNWAHVLCSVWIPEVKFGDVEIMEPVESIGLIPGWRWKETCCICNLPGGACISCADQCGKHFHVTCAIAARYTMGFQTNDSGKGSKSHAASITDGEPETPTTFTVSSSSSLSPRVWCSDHVLKGKNVLKISDLVEDGDRIKTTLAYYIHHYKKCDSFGTGAMRKARFVNTVTGGNGGGGHQLRRPIIIWSSKTGKRVLASASAPPMVHCVSCGVDASPFWWEVPASSSGTVGSEEVKRDGDVEMEDSNRGGDKLGRVCQRCHSSNLPITEANPDNSTGTNIDTGYPS